jgi:GDSL-like Lipase/Acylhydrolase.
VFAFIQGCTSANESAPADEALSVAPAPQTHFQYTGRIDFSDTAAPKISWPGSQVAAGFSGPYLALTLDDQFGKNYFSVFIDGDWNNPFIIDCEPGVKDYVVSTNLSPGKHNFTLFKRTEGEEGRTGFLGVKLAVGEGLLAPPPKPTRKIEFFGDSVTSGMGNEAALDADDDVLAEKNNFLAYGAITARNLNAEYVSTSQSGIGILASWNPFLMPEFYDQLDAVDNNDSKWDFSSWQPDVVVINLFQNDNSLVEEVLNPVPTDEQRIAAYEDFLARIRAVYPQAYIVATLGSMDAVRAGSPWPGYIRTAVARFSEQNSDARIATFFFPDVGFYKHPRVQHHQHNAELLTGFIKQKMGW